VLRVLKTVSSEDQQRQNERVNAAISKVYDKFVKELGEEFLD